MEIDADVQFQHRVWIGQRVGWFVIGTLIITALLGFFGSGPMSRASAQGDGLSIEYERFARLQQPTKLRLMLLTAGPAQIEIGHRYFKSVQIEQITPEPSGVETADDWLIYRFAGPGPKAVIFHLKPEEVGGLAGRARIAGGNPVEFRQFVYP
jgi:hypothetical protein